MSFELEASIDPTYCPSVKLFKWRSTRTGLEVVLIKRASPSVQGYFAVASEANDNSGCPHTLEHIVFMGSKKYPYKGLLDLLGAKQMSNTNAWTAQDQTCYTLVSAGYEGFLTLLPVYLDHILNATVHDSACLTEVYHIDGQGEEKGVVFSEMQGHEHASTSLINEEIQRLLYPSDSGYATNTGGNLTALRKLAPETIASYHSDVYRPSNLSVIVSGDIEPEVLISKMEEIDSTLRGIDKDSVPDSVTKRHRPFLDSEKTNQPSPLTQTRISEILFPDSMETSGELTVSWLGPDVSDTLSNTALEVVMTYLTMHDVGKLQQTFVNVNKDDALAAEVGFYLNAYLRTQTELSFYGVPTTHLRTAGEKLLKYLDTTLIEELDFSLLQQCIENLHDSFINSAETTWDTLIELALSDFLYGDQKNTFQEWLGSMSEFDQLRSWTPENWKDFIKQFVVSSPKACVLGRPSKDEHVRIEAEKKARAKHIRETEDLDKRARELEKAIEQHMLPIPDEVLAKFPSPDLSKIRFISSKTAATAALVSNLPGKDLYLNSETQALLDPHAEANKLALNFESIPSQFVTINLFISPTDLVDQSLYPLIDVILTNAFAMPMVLDDGRKLSADEVAQEVKRDLLKANVGADWALPEMISIRIVAKSSNYLLAVEWIKRVMFNVLFDTEKVAVFIARHLKILGEYKRSETALLNSAIEETMFTEKSISRQVDVLITEPIVTQYERDIPQAATNAKLLADQLFQIDQIRGVIIGDVPKLANACPNNDILAPWNELASKLSAKKQGEATGKLAPIRTPKDFLSNKGKNPGNEALIVLCAATDSCHVKSIALGPSKYGHEDLPALTLANAYLDMAEGPYWTAVRGPGLAYGARNSTSVQSGKVSCHINSAADPLAALNACSGVIQDLVSGKTTVTEQDLEKAVALTVNSLAEMLAQPVDAAAEKFMDTAIKGYQPEYVYKIIDEIRSVTVSQFLGVIEKYYLPLFDSRSSSLFVVAPPIDSEKLEGALKQIGYKVTVREVEVDANSDSEGDSEDYGYDSESE